MAEVVKGRWYPEKPPALDGEDDIHYTNRMLGRYGDDQCPYNHARNRQCSIGYHEECSERGDRWGGYPADRACKCPCHEPGNGMWTVAITRPDGHQAEYKMNENAARYLPGGREFRSLEAGALVAALRLVAAKHPEAAKGSAAKGWTQWFKMDGVYPEHVWSCAGCGAELTGDARGTTMTHPPECTSLIPQPKPEPPG